MKLKNINGYNNPNWKGGRKTERGYIYIYSPEHPRSNKNYVYEHRLVMEKHIGRFLKDFECIHHINGNRGDNRISNLILLTSSEHMKKYHPEVGVSTRFKIGQLKGKKLSKETKRRMSDGAKRRWAKRNNN